MEAGAKVYCRSAMAWQQLYSSAQRKVEIRSILAMDAAMLVAGKEALQPRRYRSTKKVPQAAR